MPGRNRKSKNYTEPATAPVTAYRLRHPLRSARASEAFLVASFIAEIHCYWAAEFDPDRAAEDLDVLIGMLPASMLAQVLVDDDGTGDQEHDHGGLGGLPTMLWAATNWIVGLDLPADDRDLWDGPPIVDR